MTDSRKTLEAVKKKTETPSISPLIKQSKDILLMQAEYLDAKSLGSFAVAQKSTLALFKEPLHKRPLRKLLQHVLYGEQKQAEVIIKQHPEMLFQKDKFKLKDYSGRTFMNVTPIVAAYGAEDVDMLEMMFKYLDDAGKIRAIEQIKEKFPKVDECKSYDFAPLVVSITSNENIDAALEKFKKDFAPGLVEEGKHFRIQHLLDAYHVYGQNDKWEDAQCEKFFVRVIGYLQSLLPACYAQALCQNIYKLVNSGESLKRVLENSDGESYYPTGTSYLRLGRDVALYCYRAEHRWSLFCSRVSGDGVDHNARTLQAYIAQKQQRLEQLCVAPFIEQSKDAQVSRKRPRPE